MDIAKRIELDKAGNFSEWYRHVLIEGDFIRYHNVSGCYILLPNSYGIWDATSNKKPYK